MNAIETGALYGGIGTALLILGWVLRGAKQWFLVGSEVVRVGKLAEELCADMKSTQHELVVHIGDTKVHIVPDRDERFYQQMMAMIDNQFKSVNAKLDIITSRCEERGKSCNTHFNSIDRSLDKLVHDPNNH